MQEVRFTYDVDTTHALTLKRTRRDNDVMVTHDAIIEKKNLMEEVQRSLQIYRARPHSTTGKAPSILLLGKKLKILTVIKEAVGEIH